MFRFPRRIALVAIPLICLFVTACYLNLTDRGLPARIRDAISKHDRLKGLTPISLTGGLPLPRHPLYKNENRAVDPPVVDNFSLAAAATSAADLPPIPSWNRPPTPHVPEHTPLLIGFTRNWRILQQAVVCYLTAGWPAGDIYVVENTGTMHANARGQLSLQNPFFLNHSRLALLGVNVITTPTLLTFAQYQNFLLYEALQRGWPHYWWSHMDVAVVAHEGREPYGSLYLKAVAALRNTTTSVREVQANREGRTSWAQVLFAYDRLALVNTRAYLEVGGWDTQIPYYMTDCDMHERLDMAGYTREERDIGQICDVGTSVDDLLVFYRKRNGPQPSFKDPNPPEAYDADRVEREEERKAKEDENKLLSDEDKDEGSKLLSDEDKEEIDEKDKRTSHPLRLYVSASTAAQHEKWPEDARGSPTYHRLIHTIQAMDHAKYRAPQGRNTWQHAQSGGQGEPFYRDPVGFETALWMTIDFGRTVFAAKWGHRDCDLRGVGLRPEHAWRVEQDWTYRERHPGYVDPPEQRGEEGVRQG
jgi:hypothetical protein